jgi:hypothetical protein
VLQAGFQRGNALVTAGIATLFTNALPIIAGMTIFHEPLPDGWLGILRISSFVLVIVGAVSLARHQKGASAAARQEREQLEDPRTPPRVPVSSRSTEGQYPQTGAIVNPARGARWRRPR